ncbi:MAG: PD40 domain-containing protein, partial [Chloroflexi bacterium]|nr:PD40 domain-containing protein [Chloroflexota bacterium]
MRILTVTLIGAGLILAVVLALAVALGWLDGGPSEPALVSPRSSPSPVAEGPTPTASAPAQAGVTPAPEPAGELALLYTQFGETEDTLWLALASQLQEPQAVATIAHAPFWGISASLSPDGRWVAYTVLPPNLPNPEEGSSAEAEVWLLPSAGGEPRLLAQGADVRLAPIWSPDSGDLMFQSIDQQRNSYTLFSVNVADKVSSLLLSMEDVASMFPLAYASTGDSFYVARVGEGGTDIFAVSVADASRREIATVDGVARDWQLSPDGERVTFVNQTGEGEWELRVLDMEDGSQFRLEAEGLSTDRELFSPVWRAGQELITLGMAPGDDGAGVLNVSLSGGAAEQLPGPEPG